MTGNDSGVVFVSISQKIYSFELVVLVLKALRGAFYKGGS